MKLLVWLLFITLFLSIPFSRVQALYDPKSVDNNKFGIHIISATANEAKDAAELVNSSGGDWGYVTVLIESNDRNVSKWQEFFNELRRKHLIPIVRIATQAEGNSWKRPEANAAIEWANFLDQLIWPIQNRYVTIYNEPNHATEWGNSVDAGDYAINLDQTINALKAKNGDFFVLNAGLDASAPQKWPAYEDEEHFLQSMNTAVPGILNKLDGWVSHSYPNPGFAGSPDDTGRGSIRTYQWELQTLSGLGVTKNLPVFITETGWKHDLGMIPDRSLPSVDTVAEFYKKAYQNVWNDNKIVAVTPFLLDYQQTPFDHFSFKIFTGQSQSNNDLSVLGAKFPNFYPQYDIINAISKTAGKPVQDSKALLVDGQFYPTIAYGEVYKIPVKIKNTGNKTWDDTLILKSKEALDGLSISTGNVAKGKTVEPGQEYTFVIYLKADKLGNYAINLNLFEGDKEFGSAPFVFSTEVKSPVKLVIQANLLWKSNSEGKYTIKAVRKLSNHEEQISLNSLGQSHVVQIPTLLPDAEYSFTISRPFYMDKSIDRIVLSGTNVLDFGDLSPNLPAALLNPKQLWQLLPLSN